jgi:hypothetical protein
MKASAWMNSFHDSVNEKMPALIRPRYRERQGDLAQDLQPRRAVDQRALLELVGDRLEIADQQPGGRSGRPARAGSGLNTVVASGTNRIEGSLAGFGIAITETEGVGGSNQESRMLSRCCYAPTHIAHRHPRGP